MLLIRLYVIAALTIACLTCVGSWRIHTSVSRRSVDDKSASKWNILASTLLSLSAWNIAVGASQSVLAVSGGGKDYGTSYIRCTHMIHD